MKIGESGGEKFSDLETVEGEIIDVKAEGYYEVRINDGRVMPFCYMPGTNGSHRRFKENPKVGEHVVVQINPFKPGYARLLIKRERFARQRCKSDSLG